MCYRVGAKFQLRVGVSLNGLNDVVSMGSVANNSLLFRTSDRTSFFLGGWPDKAQVLILTDHHLTVYGHASVYIIRHLLVGCILLLIKGIIHAVEGVVYNTCTCTGHRQFTSSSKLVHNNYDAGVYVCRLPF